MPDNFNVYDNMAQLLNYILRQTRFLKADCCVSLIISAVIAVGIVSCAPSSSYYGNNLDETETLMQADVDSAMAILDAIDPSDLKADSLRVKYHYLRAFGHLRQNRSMIGDSLIASAHEYYRGKDVVRDMRSGTAFAWYKFWVGDTSGAIAMLDSLISLPDVPDSVIAPTLRIRVLLGASEYQGEALIPLARRLMSIETDTLRQLEAKYMLLSAYEYSEKLDSALMLSDELIEYARAHNRGDRQFVFELERAQILGEMGRTAESDEVVEGIFRKSSPDNGAADYLHLSLIHI